MNATDSSKTRARRLLAVLAFAIALAVVQGFLRAEHDSAADGRSADPRGELARVAALNRRQTEIVEQLHRQRAELKRVQRGMLPRERTPVVVSSVSDLLNGIAEATDVHLGQANVVIDSATTLHRATAHFTIQGTPEAVVAFLDSIERSETGIATRALQITRTAGTATSALTWMGSMDVDLLLRRTEP